MRRTAFLAGATQTMARATALLGIGPYLSLETADVIPLGLSDDNPRLRVAALGALECAPADIRVRFAFAALSDTVRAVRIEAARLLASIPAGYVNLADLYRLQGNEAEGEKILRRALGVIPGSADLQHALGLSLVRARRTGAALEELRKAAALDPANPRYVCTYAVALNSTGSPEEAIEVLEAAYVTHRYDTDILTALVAFHRDLGNQSAARAYSDELDSLAP